MIGVVTAAVCMLFFAWPPLRRLGQASPLSVLRADIGIEESQRAGDYVIGAASIVGLMWWYSGSAAVTFAVVSGLSVVVGLGFFVARALLSGGRRAGRLRWQHLAGCPRGITAQRPSQRITDGDFRDGDYADVAALCGPLLVDRAVAGSASRRCA